MEHVNVKYKTITVCGSKGTENLKGLGLDKELDVAPKAQFVKGRANELHLTKVKNFGSAKDLVKGVKRKKQQTGRKYLQIVYLT